MNGIANVLKPIGMTSTDVVRWVQRKTKAEKVGHIGTLDPGAAGVLPICLGKATRLAEYYTNQKKSYRAEITLGIATDTQDSFGEELSRTLPEVSKGEFEEALNKLIGNIEQLPPMFSAVRKNGRHLYEYARNGIEVERNKRLITIYNLELVDWQENIFPRAIFDIECSKGTYVRTICDDLGRELGCGGHMSFLLRLGSGSFRLEDSYTLEEIEKCLTKADTSFLTSLEWGLDLPRVNLPPIRLEPFKNGLSTSLGMIEEVINNESTVQVYCNHRFIGIGIVNDADLRPYKVII